MRFATALASVRAPRLGGALKLLRFVCRPAAEHSSDASSVRDQCGCRVGFDALSGLGFQLVDERIEDLARARRIACGVDAVGGLHLVGEARAGANTCDRV